MKKLYLLISIFIFLGLGCTPTQETYQKTSPANFERYPHSDESYFRNYFSNTTETLDPIEGVWTCSGTYVTNGVREDLPNYGRVAIIKDKNNYKRDFIEVTLGGGDAEWDDYIGCITAHFSKSPTSNNYISKQFSTDGSVDNMNFSFYDDGTLRAKGNRNITVDNNIYRQSYDQYYIKLFPKTNITEKNETQISYGSGFLISTKGYVVSNLHVVENSKQYDVCFPIANKTYSGVIKLKDKENDLVVLELKNFSYSEISNDDIPYTFADPWGVKVGQESYSLGFPLGTFLGTNASLSSGRITNLNGIEYNPRLFQINNNLQPGNSGGPLFNINGELVGIVVSGLNAKFFYENAGIIPQNVNFAIKNSYLTLLVSQLNINSEIQNRTNQLSNLKMEDQIEKVKYLIAQIIAK
ncbi:MAG: serine protease [Ignavibacteriae bacterium]|nr:serine protease [Ignavibacteriota bacterium]